MRGAPARHPGRTGTPSSLSWRTATPSSWSTFGRPGKGALPDCSKRPAQRQRTLVQLVQFASEDVTYLPLYYQVDVHAIRTGLAGLVARWPGQPGMAFNAHTWYWER